MWFSTEAKSQNPTPPLFREENFTKKVLFPIFIPKFFVLEKKWKSTRRFLCQPSSMMVMVILWWTTEAGLASLVSGAGKGWKKVHLALMTRGLGCLNKITCRMPRLFAQQIADGPRLRPFSCGKRCYGQVEALQRAKGRPPFTISLSASWNILPLWGLFQTKNIQIFASESTAVRLKEGTAF